MKNLQKELQEFGIPADAVQVLDEPRPRLINYLDLVPSDVASDADRLLPDAVAESQGKPLLYLINESKLASPPALQKPQLSKLSRALACRGEDVYLARVLPGQLLVERVTLHDHEQNWVEFDAQSSHATTFFSQLAAGSLPIGRTDSRSVFDEMLKLVIHAANRLADDVAQPDVLSLIGRALFFRFLIDREVVSSKDLHRISPTSANLFECFIEPDAAYRTSRWLDETFNGHFLPLTSDTKRFFNELGSLKSSPFQHLTAILRGWEPAGREYQLKIDWNDFDFAHIPVGLMSQVYEAFCWKWERETAQHTSVHYTPRHLAELLVDEAFDRLDNAVAARVLDCACGPGVFLVLAFRRLYRERWEATGKRPNTRTIRSILEKQLAGFDVSESALRLAALSLYLTAIELDPKPVPPEKLRFSDLMNTVLFNHRRPKDPDIGPVLGSLGDHVPNSFNSRFDLVLSNPPWTSWHPPNPPAPKGTKRPRKKKVPPNPFDTLLTSVCKDVLRRGGRDDLADDYVHPDVTPDIAFLFRATEWCKPGGRIAMVLPARILLKQAKTPAAARKVLLSYIHIAGIINGSNLADSAVWPGMGQPFMLLFASNERPPSPYIIHFVTPQFDAGLSGHGRISIDSKSSRAINVCESFASPWFWKAHSIGTTLDVDVIQRLAAPNTQQLSRYWHDQSLECGKGFQEAKNQPQKPAPFMRDYRELVDDTEFRHVIDTSLLEHSKRTQAFNPRKEAIYRGPVLVVKQSPGADDELSRSLMCVDNVLYPERYMGFSAQGHPEAELLVMYLHLVVESSVWMYYMLMTSPELGAERRRIRKDDVNGFPIVPFEKLSSKQRAYVRTLCNRLEKGDASVHDDIDVFVATLYGLDQLDVEVIRDSLEVARPYRESRRRAWVRPTATEKGLFARRLAAVLAPFLKVVGQKSQVTPLTKSAWSEWWKRLPYDGVVVNTNAGQSDEMKEHAIHEMIFTLGRDTGASQVIHVVDGSIIVAILDQYRYWTPSRARLLGADIVRNYLGVLEG